jgi:cytochrome c-type biogenesis protein CcmH
LLEEEKTKGEIYAFLTSKYGEWIVYQPTFSKSNLLLWTLPYFIFIVGGLIIFLITRKSKNNKAN